MSKQEKRFVFALLVAFLLASLVTPAWGGLVTSDNGIIITSTTGATSPVFQVTDTAILEGGTITVDLSLIRWVFASYSVADTNIEVQTTAAGVVWTPVIDSSGDFMTLTSSGGDTNVDDTITVTFRGTATEPWLAGTGYMTFPVTLARTDTAETADFNFEMDVPPVLSGLSVTDGTDITSPTGETSPMITVLDSPITQDGTITVNVESLGTYTTGGQLTDANVQVSSSAAAPVVWIRSVSPDGKTLTLTSTGGDTNPGDTITLTFTGAGGNPWIPNDLMTMADIKRDDTGDTVTTYIQFHVPAPGGLDAEDGSMIMSATGTTSPVLTITHVPVAQDGTITIDISGINPYVTGGHLTNANVQVSDNAAAATWTGSVSGNTLTLTSNGGETAANEMVTVTFTGSGGTPWVADTGALQVIPLTAVRQDTLESVSFNFIIDTGGRPVTDFSAAPRSGAVPLDVTFTDLSTVNPVEWNWSFGDGTYSELHNPSHTYTTSGLYTVSLNATNTRGSSIRSKADYIDVYAVGTGQADSGITGLTLNTCRPWRQRVQVDTSVLDCDLSPDNTVLVIRPPADRGFGSITLDSADGIGFVQDGDIITGNLTGVHFVSADIAPASGFSPDVGTNAAFNWSADLSSYPCNAVVSASIRERITAENYNRLVLIGNGNSPPAVPKGTAYSVILTKFNFPANIPVTIHASVHPDWRTSLDPTSTVFIWRIADDGKTGQILPTDYLSTDPVNNLDYYEADSPLGMSTFGLSAFTGNNNPFQLVTLAITEHVEPAPPSQPNTAAGESDTVQTVAPAASPAPTAAAPPKAAPPAPPASTAAATLIATQEATATEAPTAAPLPAEPRQAAIPDSSAAPVGAMGIFSGLVEWITVNPVTLGVIFVFIILVVIYENRQRRNW